MQIKHYDILNELFATDRAKGNDARTTKERKKQWEKDNIDLNTILRIGNVCGKCWCV